MSDGRHAISQITNIQIITIETRNLHQFFKLPFSVHDLILRYSGIAFFHHPVKNIYPRLTNHLCSESNTLSNGIDKAQMFSVSSIPHHCRLGQCNNYHIPVEPKKPIQQILIWNILYNFTTKICTCHMLFDVAIYSTAQYIAFEKIGLNHSFIDSTSSLARISLNRFAHEVCIFKL
ncbi:hypothetical protein AGLY_013062 [Aphis glycines]|uniref:Uncharacterized protein n=1 Tax=Aphis glycines TaxID=307491 RepID=A0A6G0T7M5_APHGL|nr:hypothetical protein AGLY_013062 [Aphis glycines]